MNYLINQYNTGRTEDKLFNSDSISREKKAIFKFIRLFQLMSLCNDTFKWIAVNIPLNQIVKHNEQGDIDILIAMLAPKYENNEMIGFDTIYRSFEVKTTTISKENIAKSIKKASKFKTVLGQIEKLKRFGAEQVFLFEIFITQAGHIYSSDSYLPMNVVNEINIKMELLPSFCGYICTLIEQIPGYDEEKTGVAHMIQNLKEAEIMKTNNGFVDLIRHIEKFNEDTKLQYLEVGDINIIAFCEKCKNLIKIKRLGPYSCKACGRSLI